MFAQIALWSFGIFSATVLPAMLYFNSKTYDVAYETRILQEKKVVLNALSRSSENLESTDVAMGDDLELCVDGRYSLRKYERGEVCENGLMGRNRVFVRKRLGEIRVHDRDAVDSDVPTFVLRTRETE